MGDPKPCPSRVRGEMRFPGPSSSQSKPRSPHHTSSLQRPRTPTKPRDAQAYLTALESTLSCGLGVSPVKSRNVDHKVKKSVKRPAMGPDASKRRTLNIRSHPKTLSELQTRPTEGVGSQIQSAVRPKSYSPESRYITVLKEYFKSVRLTKLENRVKERTVEALRKLDTLIQETQSQQERLLQDSRKLEEEKLHVEAENNFFLKYLSKKNDQCRKKHEDLWKQYFQECEEIEQRKQELAFMYIQRTEDLQAQLLQGRKTQSNLKLQLQAMSHISSVRDRQEMKVQMLVKAQENIKAETAAKDQEAHLQFLQQKALLDKKMHELDMLQIRGSNARQFRSKLQALKLTAKHAYSEFCLGVSRENQQLRKELQRLIQEYHKLETVKLQLKKQIQQLKEKQLYLEALVRGRQRLKEDRESHSTCKSVP